MLTSPSRDHVEITPEFRAYASNQYAFQRANPVSPFDASRVNAAPEKWWNKFYGNHTANFFKDRKWLRQEFPILEELTKPPEPKQGGDRRAQILEVGAGAGNTAFPILRVNRNPGLFIHACDFSKKAVELIQSSPDYDPVYIRASVWDIASIDSPLPPGVEEGSIDVVLLIFIFSALSRTQWKQAVHNIWQALKPGGEVCFRDYGRGDLAQVRFKKERWLDENFYARGDGTRVYFFEEEELREIWGGSLREGREMTHAYEAKEFEHGQDHNPNGNDIVREAIIANCTSEEDCSLIPSFEIVSLGVDRRLLINRQKQLKMYRCWIQGNFRKPGRSDQRDVTSHSTSQQNDVDSSSTSLK